MTSEAKAQTKAVARRRTAALPALFLWVLGAAIILMAGYAQAATPHVPPQATTGAPLH
jgi:hypothetical protein